jgi:hypothetical protein
VLCASKVEVGDGSKRTSNSSSYSPRVDALSAYSTCGHLGLFSKHKHQTLAPVLVLVASRRVGHRSGLWLWVTGFSIVRYNKCTGHELN